MAYKIGVHLAIVALACVVGLGGGRTADAQIPVNPALAKVIADAQTEGTILLHMSIGQFGGAAGAQAQEDALNKVFGTHLKIQWSPGPAYGPLAAELYQAMQAGQPASSDIYYGTPQQIVPFLDRGLFKAIDWHGLMPDRVSPQMVEADNRAMRVVTLLPSILYNIQGAPWVPQIKTAADLLKPEYKGKFATTPFLAGFDVVTVPELWGRQKTEDYVHQLAGQISGLLDCSTPDRIGSGEIPALALDCAGKDDSAPKYLGKNILSTQIVSDMAERRYTYALIPTNAVHPNAAILYALYQVTADGQENWYPKYWGGDLTEFPNSQNGKKVAAAEAQGIKFTDVTIDWWKAHPGIDQEVGKLIKIINEQR